MRSDSVKDLLTPQSVGLTECGCQVTIIKNDLSSAFDIVAVVEIKPHAWQKHAKKREIIVQFSSNSANDNHEQLSCDSNSEKAILLNLNSFKKHN